MNGIKSNRKEIKKEQDTANQAASIIMNWVEQTTEADAYNTYLLVKNDNVPLHKKPRMIEIAMREAHLPQGGPINVREAILHGIEGLTQITTIRDLKDTVQVVNSAIISVINIAKEVQDHHDTEAALINESINSGQRRLNRAMQPPANAPEEWAPNDAVVENARNAIRDATSKLVALQQRTQSDQIEGLSATTMARKILGLMENNNELSAIRSKLWDLAHDSRTIHQWPTFHTFFTTIIGQIEGMKSISSAQHSTSTHHGLAAAAVEEDVGAAYARNSKQQPCFDHLIEGNCDNYRCQRSHDEPAGSQARFAPLLAANKRLTSQLKDQSARLRDLEERRPSGRDSIPTKRTLDDRDKSPGSYRGRDRRERDRSPSAESDRKRPSTPHRGDHSRSKSRDSRDSRDSRNSQGGRHNRGSK